MSKKKKKSVKPTIANKDAVGLALIINRQKNISSTLGQTGDIIVIHPLGHIFSGFEIASFDICEISEDCLATAEQELLKTGSNIVYPFRTKEHPISCVAVNPQAIVSGFITKDDLKHKGG